MWLCRTEVPARVRELLPCRASVAVQRSSCQWPATYNVCPLRVQGADAGPAEARAAGGQPAHHGRRHPAAAGQPEGPHCVRGAAPQGRGGILAGLWAGWFWEGGL